MLRYRIPGGSSGAPERAALLSSHNVHLFTSAGAFTHVATLLNDDAYIFYNSGERTQARAATLVARLCTIKPSLVLEALQAGVLCTLVHISQRDDDAASFAALTAFYHII
ncbi:g1229 [Coccomyxa elongata]